MKTLHHRHCHYPTLLLSNTMCHRHTRTQTPSRSLESTLTPSTMTPSVLMASPPSSAGSPLMTQTRAMKPLRMQVDPYSSVGSHQLVSTLLSCQGMGGVYREAVDMCCEDMVEMAQGMSDSARTYG